MNLLEFKLFLKFRCLQLLLHQSPFNQLQLEVKDIPPNYFEIVFHFTASMLTLFSSLFFYHCSPVESSRFGSSGNLSQTSSQLSETGQESTAGSEMEECFHSYHNTGLHPPNGQPHANGHLPPSGHSMVGEQDIHRVSFDMEQGLKKEMLTERGSSKLQRQCF